MNSSTAPSAIIIDASIAARAILPIKTDHEQYLNLFIEWHRQQAALIAPQIWLPEVVSVVRQMIYLGAISEDEGTTAVDDIFRLGVEVITSDIDLCQNALKWAGVMGQSKAYDGFYLALAERSNGNFVTADKRLANAAREAGAGFVHWIGEEKG